MQTLRSFLSILLIALFIPSPSAVANASRSSAAMRARSASGAGGGAAAGGGAGGVMPGAAGGGGSAANAHAARRSQEALQRAQTAQDIQNAMRASQSAARQRAASTYNPHRHGQALPSVPNGLGAGGLQVAEGIEQDPSLWQGAQLPTVTSPDGRTVVTVRQEAAQALLTWQSFNIGKETTLHFDQSAGGTDKSNWTAFNRVLGSDVSPSQILGKIRADGQVYIINTNGVIFGNNSQVDARSLTVSTLPINRHLVENGLLNNPDSQFLFSGLALPAGVNGAPAFTPEPPSAELGRYGDVLVMAGAQLRSTLADDGNGGRIMLVGANVENHGTISTPGGQTILAAGLQVGIAAHASSDASLRGLDVYVGAVDANSGHALNSGLIEVERGNATMVGKTVELQNGVIASSTSVSLNGRIDLIAGYNAVSNPLAAGTSASDTYKPFYNTTAGTVLIGADSLLSILPELGSTEKVAATELALRSQVNISGRDIYFGERAMVLVPSGIVNVNAGVWQVLNGVGRGSEFVNANGQIYLDRDVIISAAGTTDVEIPLSQVLLTVELRGAELADSPVQRDDILRGETITVDIRKRGTLNGVDWVGSPLADVSGYLGLIERTVAELTLAGGEVNFNAGGSIVMQEGSQVDVSGGFARYEGGAVETTVLLRNGRKINIADALPNVQYDSVYRRNAEGVLGAGGGYSKPLAIGGSSYEPGYLEGAAGGKLSLSASAMALDGRLLGLTVAGERQLGTPAQHASLTLAFETRDLAIRPGDTYPVISPNAPVVSFVNAEVEAPAAGAFTPGQGANGAVLPPERVQNVELSADLLGPDGFGAVTVRNREGSIRVDEGVVIHGQARGALRLEGANVTVNGAIRIAGGTIDLSAYAISYDTVNRLTLLANQSNPTAPGERGTVLLGSGAELNTAGQIVLPAGQGTGTFETYSINGGSVSVRGFDTRLEAGSHVDVSGGATLNSSGKVVYGNSGAISLEGGRDLVIQSVLGGSLVMAGELSGYSGARGGSLSLLAPAISIGADIPGALLLDSDFFNQGGFSSFNIRGIGLPGAQRDTFISGVTIGSGALINPQVTGLRAKGDASGLVLEEWNGVEGLRTPASLSFGGVGASDPYGRVMLVRGQIEMQEGAQIETDAGGSVSFNANAIDLHGSVTTPGGSIIVKGGSSYDAIVPNSQEALATVYLGKTAKLIAAGKVVSLPEPQAPNAGKAYGGGTITVEGNIVAEKGALLDVSGTSAVLDMPAYYSPVSSAAQKSGKHSYAPIRVDTAGGTIRLAGSQMLVSDATLAGRSGGSEASGGTLSVSSGRFYPANTILTTTADVTLSVSEAGDLLDYRETLADARGIGLAVVPASGARTDERGRIGGYFSMDDFAQGGFDNLALGGNVEFSEAVRIDARGSVRIASGGVLRSSSAPVEIHAAHVAIGQDFKAPQDPSQKEFLFTKNEINEPDGREHNFEPEGGTGSLQVHADSIDIGTLVLNGIGEAQFLASQSGSIRGEGSLNIRGDLTLEAGQIHPLTARGFDITAFNPANGREGSVRFGGGNVSLDLPYSAGGKLGVYAANIVQEGVLRAPFGVINLGWDGTGAAPRNAVSGGAAPVTSAVVLGQGSVTSVSGVGADGKGITLPYGILLNGISWIDPRGVDISLGGLPEKKVNLSGKDVVTEEGALIDLRGGGDLFAYRWVPGVGGSRDVLSLPGSFAVIPGYQGLATEASFNSASVNNTLGSDKGYADGSLKAGDQVYLDGSSGLKPGYYTLLPARYALLEGAFLVTPKTGVPTGSGKAQPIADGSYLVSGYRVDGLTGNASAGTALSLFEVASRDVVMARSQYAVYSANEFLASAATDREMAVPRLPQDSGQLVFTASERMRLEGDLLAQTVANGRGSFVDINSALDILIGSGAQPASGFLYLDTDTLNAFAAESLLVGGVRSVEDGVVTVRANSAKVTLDNAGTPLVGADIILVGKDSVQLAEGAQLRGEAAASSAFTASTLRLGDADTEGSGNGALVRVSADSRASVERQGVGAASTAQLVVREGVQIGGSSVTLDSSSQTLIDPQAVLHAQALNLGSGRISLVLEEGLSAAPDSGLILSGPALDSILASARSLGLSSYSSIDVYGTGLVGNAQVEQLLLNTPVLRAFATDGGQTAFMASSLLLQNTTGTVARTDTLSVSGSLILSADELRLGNGVIGTDGFDRTILEGGSGVRLLGKGGLNAASDLEIVSALLVGGTGSDYKLHASGDFVSQRGASAIASEGSIQPGLAGSVSIEGESVTLGSDILLPAGKVSVRARSGDLVAQSDSGMRVDVSGGSRDFYDRSVPTDAGSVRFTADAGNVVIGDGAVVDVSGSGAMAGSVRIDAVAGALLLDGELFGGTNKGASFSLDALHLADAFGNRATSIAALDTALNGSGFDAVRNYRVRSGDVDVDGIAKSSAYTLSADGGSIHVSGEVDASGTTGGLIELRAADDVILEDGAVLSVAAKTFNSAGKGGKVFLEAGSQINGVVNRDARVGIRSGSLIDLSVGSAGADSAANAAKGLHSGVLHLRAAQNVTYSDLGIDVIEGEIRDASHIIVEGYRLYDLTAAGGSITTAVRNAILQNGNTFLGAAGTANQNYNAMLSRISGGDAVLADQLVLQVGAEVINRTGDLTLGNAASTVTADWDLSGYRFGARSSAGVLTLRAAGDIGIYDALSDGFSGTEMWLATLKTANPLLPANAQSWSYRLASGADISAADFRRALPSELLTQDKGSLLIGRNAGAASGGSGQSATTRTAIRNRFQVIRTGSGDIDVVSGRDIRFLNPFASIYTAGTVVTNPTRLHAQGAQEDDFVLPKMKNDGVAFQQGDLGPLPEDYPVQYSHSGGDVAVYAAGDIGRYTRDNSNRLVLDTSRQLPTNWLYRRGHLGADGNFGQVLIEQGRSRFDDPSASTTWWIDFSNFFQSVGALGGGNVSLIAGQDIVNVDAVVPTNARAPMGAPNPQMLVELGGGDLRVQAGRNIDGGVYYVERGKGTLIAGDRIKTNEARSINPGILHNLNNPERQPESTWMPTTLFLGKGSLDVSAAGDVLLGSVSNPFLLPQGLGNRFWYKTYFSTYAKDSSVSVRSSGGDVALRGEVSLPNETGMTTFLGAWLASQNVLERTSNTAAFYQPWLRLTETAVDSFETMLTALPPSLQLVALSGDINLSGSFNLWPSATGALELYSAGNIHALNPNGISVILGQRLTTWNSSSINLSDADPASLPGAVNPVSYYSLVGDARVDNYVTKGGFLQNLDRFFAETGATNSVLQTKQALHASGLLHRKDPDPVYIYAGGGDISGLTLYSAKPARIIASRDISDIAFYLQNLSAGQTSLVAAGRDIIAYHANSDLRLRALSAGNGFHIDNSAALGGDIQLGGPGLLQVLAGRNLDLGVGPSGANGLSSGVTTIGNLRNPFLPGQGAQIIAGAGIGASFGLKDSELDFPAFIGAFLDPATGKAEIVTRYLAEVGRLMGLDRPALDQIVWSDFLKLDAAEQLPLVEQIHRMAQANNDLPADDKLDTPEKIASFVRTFLNPETGGELAARYLGDLQELRGQSDNALYWQQFSSAGEEGRALLALNVFYSVLRDSGRDYNNPDSETFGNYDNGYAAIKTLFPENTTAAEAVGLSAFTDADAEEASRWKGDISLTSRQIKTAAGGNISLFAPGGGIVVGFPVANARADQGILTEAGGDIRIFTHESVEVGSSRIFTLRGGDIAIWSSRGDIAAGSAARTVRSAPPTRVVIDLQTASVLTDLSGLATGGGIGALQTVKGAAASDIDLIAPEGSVDAGDAGIRVSGSVNIAAREVRNASSIVTGAGTATGVPVATVSMPSVSGLNAAATAAQTAATAMSNSMDAGSRSGMGGDAVPSVISVEVLGYGEEEDEKSRSAQVVTPAQEHLKKDSPLI